MTIRMLNVGALTVALVLGACSDSTEEGPDPVAIEMLDGDGQDGSIGTALAEPLRVIVTDELDAPAAGVVVTWTVTSGGGSITPSSTTDADGIAEATFTLGPANGEHRAEASVSGLAGSPVGFTAVAGGIVPPPPGDITLASITPAPANAVFIHDMFVRDGLAFVFAWDAGVIIYDVGNGMSGGTPTVPQQVGARIPGNAGLPCACVHNGWWFHNPNTSEKKYLFLGQEGPGSIGTSSSGDIHVLDVTDLSNPVEVASYHHPNLPDGSGTSRSVGVHNFWMDEANEILYAAFYNGGVVALDVSGTLAGDLSSRVISSVRPGGAGGTYTWGVQVANGSIYAIDMLTGLYQLQLTNDILDVVAGGNNVPERFSSDLWVHGDHAYTGTWGFRTEPGNALKVWALDAGGAPSLTNTVTLTGIGTVSDVEVSANGSWLALTAEYGMNAGLHLYSLADPGNPVFLDRYLVASPNGGLHTGTIAEIGGRTYVFAARDPAPGGPALVILDVTDVIP
ncbi:MAG TPA: Ig-like domain-containing protein [Gemmatimonadales bacterium]|nr:Ig-like domain-containing protein [Gemmatimonadales bacterium]